MIYHVDAKSSVSGDGSREKPFLKIGQAAAIAMPGDEVVVWPGVYRESVDPANAGTEDARITYRAAEKGTAVITGAEPVKSWVPEGGGVWKTEIPNTFFTDRNPFTTQVAGDWFIITRPAHTGDVFLNGRSMYEVLEKEKVCTPVRSSVSWDPDFSVYTWYTCQDEANDATILYANFHGYDPNIENVEISVRKSCFYPEKEGIGYITLSGFTVCQAATQWAPPTALQEGMIGPHWSRGWIIEDCEIFESKCCGISLGKYYQPYDNNRWNTEKYKDGAQTMRDIVLSAWREGWNKDNIGSHIVRRCNIHDCGQTGIAGNLGGVFSLIEDNHIHHINNKQNLSGAEIAGIKMHAAIDVVFRHNHIHHCTRGIWLDWQAQGTRVTGNLLHDNTLPYDFLMHERTATLGEDIWIEVSHGPTLLDHNILLSTRSVRLATQGVAFVHNLIGGSFTAVGRGTDNGAPNLNSARYTPYHVPHSTDVQGFMTFLHGDMRFYNNIFVQQSFHPFLVTFTERSRFSQWDDGNLTVGTWPFDGYQTREEWEKEFEGYCGEGGVRTDRYYIHLPVWSRDNVYFNGAKPWRKELSAVVDEEHHVEMKLTDDDGMRLKTNIAQLLSCRGSIVDSAVLGKAFEPDEYFENPDGTPITFDTDYFGRKTGENPLPGPFADIDAYNGMVSLWE